MRLTGADSSYRDAFRHHPIYGWTANPERPDVDRLNAQGFRFGELPRQKPPGVRRLLLLGDSFTFGSAYPRAATFPGLLENWLNDAGERWEVIPLAAGGWGTGQQLLALRHAGLALDPDAVVLQLLPYNDLCNNSRPLAFGCDLQDYYRPYFVDREGDLELTWFQPQRAAWRRRSALFRLVERRRWLSLGPPESAPNLTPKEQRQWIRSIHRQYSLAAGLAYKPGLYSLTPGQDVPPAIRQSWSISRRLVSEIAATLEARQIPLLGMVVPFADTFGPQWVRFHSEPGSWPRGAAGAAIRPGHGTATVEGWLKSRQVPVLSLRRKMLRSPIGAKDFFHPYGKANDRHFNRLGHDQVAQWLLEAMADLGWTEASAPDRWSRSHDLLGLPTAPVATLGLTATPRKATSRSRLGRGQQTRLVFESPQAHDLELAFRFQTVQPMRRIEISINGQLRWRRRTGERQGTRLGDVIPFEVRPGLNQIVFRYRPGVGEGEPAVRFEALELKAPSS
ncbi:MAG: SGNH/GDSL hydrolase family protein [Acidobacteriota bacterium]